MSGMIIPKYNLVITFDVTQDREEAFYRFALSELVPAMQNMGLYLVRAWHTAYGAYPDRQSEFVAEDLATIHAALASDEFHKMESRLLELVTNYDRKIVEFSDKFQMVRSNN